MSFKNAKICGDGITYEIYSRQAPGVNRGHKDFIMSRSELTDFALCPEKWRDGSDEEDDSTPSTVWGSLIDVLSLTPEKFDQLYAVAPETYTSDKRETKDWNWNAKVCKEWREERKAEGREVIKADLRKAAELAVQAIKKVPDVFEILTCSKKQVMVVAEWHDKDTGIIIPVRVLIDIVPDVNHKIYGKCLGDFKTARNGDPEGWARVVDDCGYDVQASLSRDIYVAATKEDRMDWVFPVQENVKPYHVVKPMPALTTEFFSWGRLKYEYALSLYAKCLSNNTWPSYSTGNRMVYGNFQLIAPDSLYRYRQMAGGVGGKISDFFPDDPQPKTEEFYRDGDITP